MAQPNAGEYPATWIDAQEVSRGEPPDARKLLSEFPKEVLDEALERYKAVGLHVDHGVPVAEVARRVGKNSRTVHRWVAAYESAGFVGGLIRKQRSDAGTHRMHPDLQLYVEGLALRPPRLNPKKIWEKACELAAREGWEPPGRRAVYNVIREMHPHLVKLAQDGPEAHAREYELVLRREADAPNQVWQADHAELKVWVLDPDDEPKKPWITFVEDDHSRAIAGYHLAFEKPSMLRTSLAFRHAVWHKADPSWRVCGIPETFYTDNGPDFVSNHIEEVAAELNVELVFSTLGRPEGKGKVERFARTIGDMFVQGLPGWAPKGSNAAKEPRKTNNCLRSKSSSSASKRLRRKSTTGECMGAPDRSRGSVGLPAVGCRGCPCRWTSSTCCLCTRQGPARCRRTASASGADSTRASTLRRTSASR